MRDTFLGSIIIDSQLNIIGFNKDMETLFPKICHGEKCYSVLAEGSTPCIGCPISSKDIEPIKIKRKYFKRSDMYFDDFELKNMISDSVLSFPEDMLENRFNKFSRYGYLDPANELITGAREYLFFSKPDLHLVNVDNPYYMYNVLSNVPFFNEAFNRYKLSYYSLQQYYNGKEYI